MTDDRTPLPSPESRAAIVDIFVQAARSGTDFAEWLAHLLAAAAARLGSTEALLEGRPGSWEAECVRSLLRGTVGMNDDLLSMFAYEAGQDPAGGTVTEWGVRFTLPGGDREDVPFPGADEGRARASVAAMREKRPEFDAVLVRRTAPRAPGPWTEAPEAGKGDDDA
jgi:hypothetical protein